MRGRGLAAAVAAFGMAACSAALPEPPSDSAFQFAAFGDTPYSDREVRAVERLIEEVNAATFADEPLSWVLHVGDIIGAPCSDAMFRARRELFAGFAPPFFYTPGDNEWADCWTEERGEYRPLERLDALRRIFFPESREGGAARDFGATSQARDPEWREFVENLRWEHRGVVFVTVHLVGSMNGREPFDARTPVDDRAADRREAAAVSWLRATFTAAHDDGASAVVLAFHGAPAFRDPPGSRRRLGFDAFLVALADEASRFERPVLLIHGDHHRYLVDRPLRDENGARIQNVTRLEVFGSSRVGWVGVTVDPEAAEPFSFERHRIRTGWF